MNAYKYDANLPWGDIKEVPTELLNKMLNNKKYQTNYYKKLISNEIKYRKAKTFLGKYSQHKGLFSEVVKTLDFIDDINKKIIKKGKL